MKKGAHHSHLGRKKWAGFRQVSLYTKQNLKKLKKLQKYWIGISVTTSLLLKPSQNKNGRKNFPLQRFLNTFSQLPAVKKYSKNGAAGKIFGPSYFDLALMSKS